MAQAIVEAGMIPFFPNIIPGYSIRELTQAGFWFDETEDVLGPWDWKIDCILGGGIAYGKFLCGGKASFATVPLYRELMNVRRATNTPDENGRRILAMLDRQGSITIKEVRELLGVKKSAADAAIAKLQHQCRVVTGAIERVYRGPEHLYNGWQVSYFCTPESLFDYSALPVSPTGEHALSLTTDHTPDESMDFLVNHLAKLNNSATAKEILKVLK